MPRPSRIIYSFVVDSHTRFQRQARVITATLLSVGVSPDDIIIHIAPDVSAETRAAISKLGACMARLQPSTIGGGYFNKIAQLQTLCRFQADTYVLCDTDLAFLDSLAAFAGDDIAWGKPVDAEIPPLEQLEALRLRVGIHTTPRIVLTTNRQRPTYATNCNGGVYILPRRILMKLFSPWHEYARLASMAQDLLAGYARHADQIGFALAMLFLNEDVAQLPVEYNFPCEAGHFSHLSDVRPLVLHHHQECDGDGLLRLTGYHFVDEAIAQINQRVAAIELSRWSTWPGPVGPEYPSDEFPCLPTP